MLLYQGIVTIRFVRKYNMRRIFGLLVILSVSALLGCTQPKASTAPVKPIGTGEGKVGVAGNKSTNTIPTQPAETKPTDSKTGEKPPVKTPEKSTESKPGDKTPPAPPK